MDNPTHPSQAFLAHSLLDSTAEGIPVRETVVSGSELLLRPVLMISLTAILGLLPAALANSIGSQAQKPLAIVVVGGMLASMFLAQYLIPVLYSCFPARAFHEAD